MTPIEEAAVAQRRWIFLRLGATAITLLLMVGAFLFLAPLHTPVVGFVLLGVAVVFHISMGFVATRLANRRLMSTRVTAEVPEEARARSAEWNAADRT